MNKVVIWDRQAEDDPLYQSKDVGDSCDTGDSIGRWKDSSCIGSVVGYGGSAGK